MRKKTTWLLPIITTLLLSACGTRLKPADITDANALSSDSSVALPKIKTHNVSTFDHFRGELAPGPHQSLLNQRQFYFAFNHYDLNIKYLKAIKAHANYLITHPNVKVLLEGNTDARGSHAYNQALGEKRAVAVAKQLQADGVASSQIRTISYGKERPVALGHTQADYAKNRRTDLVYSEQ